MNPTFAEVDAGRSLKPSAGKRRLAFALFILSIGGIWLLRTDPQTTPSVSILPPDYSIPAPLLPLPDRWIPPTWGPLWKLRYAVLGKPFVVDIQTELLHFGAAGESQLIALLQHQPPIASSNGVSAWILPDDSLGSFRSSVMRGQNIKTQGSRTTTGEGVLSTMSMTTSAQTQTGGLTAGYFHSFAVRKLGHGVELSGGFVSSEVVTNSMSGPATSPLDVSLHTNLTLVAIMQIPRGHGVFLFDTNRARPGMAGMGLVIEVKAQ